MKRFSRPRSVTLRNFGFLGLDLLVYEDAVGSCRKSLQVKPDLAEAHNNLCWSYQRLRRYAEAYLNLGAAYSGMERSEEAMASYKQAIRIKPPLAEAHLNLGMTYLKLGDRGSAMEEYKILKELDKELANKLFNLIFE